MPFVLTICHAIERPSLKWKVRGVFKRTADRTYSQCEDIHERLPTKTLRRGDA